MSKLLDIVERAVWTLVQTTTAGAMVLGWNALDIGPDLSLAFVPPLAFLLSAIKGELASKFGNGTAATLPADVEPVPIEQVVAIIDEEDDARDRDPETGRYI